ncbi:unnamed protein product [Mytilus coruscus]|uniref:Integrase catalytic domain-containing protein n=1 Tax=Mytilus coruscus TaxID=42192 RepID=A0A6J8EC05_MYTCO|nr:unnamed protein product [Mytilus coruscus]
MQERVNITEEEEVVMFTGNVREDITPLGMDARNCAVLDSACSSTVCGQLWMRSYVDSLSGTDKAKIFKENGNKVFKFGGGTRLKSIGEYSLPAVIAAMKKAGVKMDLENDTAEIFGQHISLNLTSSGHYCIPIDKTEEIPVADVCAVRLEELDSKKRYATLLKLHRQFAHPPMKRLIALLKDAGVWKEEYEQEMSTIEEQCETCKRYAKTPPRPVVSLPMASQFNKKVAMDLKQWNGRWILHMIDMWSRYTVSVFIDRKKATGVIEKMMTNWIGIFGVIGTILTDNGGEFSSDEMREVASILNVKVYTTAGESPFQNGLCEGVHAITDTMLMKLQADYRQVNDQSLLCWANMTRNALQMWNGFSSH